MARAHLVCGFLGVGKTTFAKRLAEQVGGVRFSVDELYLQLFASGPTYDVDRAALDRLFAALDQLWPQVVRAGTDVVLDFGFWSRERRDHARTLADAQGVQTQLYWLRCPDDVALTRCLTRNGAADAFLFSEQGFYELKPHFQPPDTDEPHALVETAAAT